MDGKIEKPSFSWRRYFTLFVVFGSCARSQGVPVINEIMYRPAAGECEWVELFNPSNDTVNLRDWILHDATSTRPLITSTDLFFPPGGYIVIASDSSILATGSGFPLHIMKNFPSLNNSGDDVFLRAPDSSLVECVPYRSSWGGGTGVSLERIDVAASPTDASNWGSSRAPSGSTPGRWNSLAPPEHDLAVESLEKIPPRPSRDQPFAFRIVIRNLGLHEAEAYRVALYDDTNGNESPDPTECVFDKTVVDPLPPGDRSIVSCELRPARCRSKVFIAAVAWEQDEAAYNDHVVDTIRFAPPYGSILINEVMYAPMADEPEWIELANATDDSVDLRGWSIGDEASWRKIGQDPAAIVPPRGFAVLSSSAELGRYYTFTTVDFITTTLPSLNNGGDVVRIADETGTLIDSMRYTPQMGGNDGRSLERVDFRKPSTATENWSPCESVERGTPGKTNSVAVREHDLSVRSISAEDADIIVTVMNTGLTRSDNADVHLYRDRNADAQPDTDEEIANETLPPIVSGDSARVVFHRSAVESGILWFIAVVDYAEDERPRDNIRSAVIVRAAPKGQLTVNEVLFAPLSGDAEWVEYVNLAGESVDVAGYRIAGALGNTGTRPTIALPLTPCRVPPNGYLVIASDSSVFTRFPSVRLETGARVVVLNRSSLDLGEDDEILFIDAAGEVVDSVAYTSDWHNPHAADTRGRSLERLNPTFPASLRSNWSTSADREGGTPGRRNSLYTERPPWQTTSTARIEVHPNPFSPDGDGFEDHTVISYELPGTISQVRLRVFDAVGRPVRTIANNIPAGTTGQYLFDGLDDNGRRLRVGVYILLLEAVDLHGARIDAVKSTMVVATPL
ncbi:MAG: lamin tail domain-containing protein [Bacteroidota bacterium]|nr:lamin tail domain-containing protein [Bacteroidota bacterium]